MKPVILTIVGGERRRLNPVSGMLGWKRAEIAVAQGKIVIGCSVLTPAGAVEVIESEQEVDVLWERGMEGVAIVPQVAPQPRDDPPAGD